MSAALDELRQTLAQRYPDALPLQPGAAGAVATGLGPVDALIPGGGLPRGRVTAWASGGGSTAVLLSACQTALSRGERAAWVDVAGVMTAESWRGGVLLLRPGSEVEGLACAEELLRSGGFGLVVVAGCGKAANRSGVRLSRAAKAGGSGLVLLGGAVEVAALRASCQILPGGYVWRRTPFGEVAEVETVRVRVEAQSLGWSGSAEVNLPVRTRPQRAGPDPFLVDRRGARRRIGWNRGIVNKSSEK